jgi:hypothetical protein
VTLFTALRTRYGASSTTLPLWIRLLLTAPFAVVLASCVLTFVSDGGTVYAAFSAVFVLGSAYAAWVLVPHLWVRSDRSVRDERRGEILARRLRQELALGEVREPGSELDQAAVSTWNRRPSSPSRW